MRNVYAFTTLLDMMINPNFARIKIGDTHHSGNKRTKQQQTGISSKQIIINPKGDINDRSWDWSGLKNIKGDGDLHNHKSLSRYRLPADESGDEWFSFPLPDHLKGADVPIEEKIRYIWKLIDDVVADLEGRRVRKAVKWRQVQNIRLNRAMKYIAEGKTEGIAFLCPRFGKTLWALGLFNRLSETYGNRAMLVPVYWLSVHTSFEDEIGAYADFQDIVYIDDKDVNAEAIACAALQAGKRILIAISLHGKMADGKTEEEMGNWVKRNRWIRSIPDADKFMFADEGDWGTHTDNQIKKINFLFDGK